MFYSALFADEWQMGYPQADAALLNELRRKQEKNTENKE